MSNKFINKLPDEVVFKLLEYHPLFFKYVYRYYELYSYNNKTVKSINITVDKYKRLKKTHSNLTNVLIRNDTIINTITIELTVNYNGYRDSLFGLSNIGYIGEGDNIQSKEDNWTHWEERSRSWRKSNLENNDVRMKMKKDITYEY